MASATTRHMTSFDRRALNITRPTAAFIKAQKAERRSSLGKPVTTGQLRPALPRHLLFH
jgi:hypothetical protein